MTPFNSKDETNKAGDGDCVSRCNDNSAGKNVVLLKKGDRECSSDLYEFPSSR
jgi:hypothetical protein